MEHEDPSKGRKMTIEEIERDADKYFPIRDKDGKPSYRRYQRETIIEIAKSFYIDGKKFVIVDGPVGCGKSAINYTIARMACDTVYLTPLKMLQDQIVSEGWGGVKMLKGRSSYACNLCGYDNTYYKCNYEGKDFRTCNNTREVNKYDEHTLDLLGSEIDNVHKMFKDNKFVLRLRSAFSNYDEYADKIQAMIDFVIEQKKIFLSIIGRDPGNYSYDYDLEKAISCTMGKPVECPANSSKLLAKMAPVRVLNPDIFYLLNKSPFSFYRNNALMVYDECQQIEGVMNRIFKQVLPLETIKRLFGVDMTHFYKITDHIELMEEMQEYIKTELAPMLAASKVIGSLGDICSVKDVYTFERFKSGTVIAEEFRKNLYGFFMNKFRADKGWSFSILDVVNHAFTDKPLPKEFAEFDSFIKMIRDDFLFYCEKFGCETTINLHDNLMKQCKKKISGVYLDTLRRERTRPLEASELLNPDDDKDKFLVSEDQIFADRIYLFGKVISKFTISAMDLLGAEGGEYPPFVISPLRMDTRVACKDLGIDEMIGPYMKNREPCLEITPIDIGRLMKWFFYSKADKVLLSSGTWVCPDSLYKAYGIPAKDTEFIKVPTLFNPKRRKVYVVDSLKFTNFSEKGGAGDDRYVYKTTDGINKFTLQLSAVLSRVRKCIKDRHKCNANMIVHCHTFDIANKIAEYGRGINDSYLIHSNHPDGRMLNNRNSHLTIFRDKDELIQQMKDNPDSGLTLVTPSVSEGVDFKDGSARAQIILKRPVPYLGDIYVKSHYKGNPDIGVEKDPNYLDRVCYTVMSQQYGRIMRNTDDWGYTIIMDQAITWALKDILKCKRRVSELNIEYFWEGLQFNPDGSFAWPFG